MDNKKQTILIVEDNLISLKLTKVILAKQGYEVLTASDGAEALNYFKTDRPELVLMDMLLPDMDGFKLAKKFRKIDSASNSHTPIVALTGLSERTFKEKCRESGIDDYLPKPFKMNELFAITQKHLKEPDAQEDKANDELEKYIGYSSLLKRTDNDLELIKTMFRMFNDNYEIYINEIEESILKNDIAVTAQKLHTLKGMLLNLEIKGVLDDLLEFEENISNIDFESANEYIEKLKVGLFETSCFIINNLLIL